MVYGFLKVGEIPKNGWFISCNLPLEWMIWGDHYRKPPYVGFHSHGGSPIAGWCISWKIPIENGNLG